MNELEKHIANSNRTMDALPPHDAKRHGGKALSETGLVKGCRRCAYIVREDRVRRRIEKRMARAASPRPPPPPSVAVPEREELATAHANRVYDVGPDEPVRSGIQCHYLNVKQAYLHGFAAAQARLAQAEKERDGWKREAADNARQWVECDSAAQEENRKLREALHGLVFQIEKEYKGNEGHLMATAAFDAFNAARAALLPVEQVGREGGSGG